VDKNIVAAAVRLDEAEALLFIEKFNSPSLTHHCHRSRFSMLLCSNAPGPGCPRRFTHCGAMSYAIKVFYLAQGANDTVAGKLSRHRLNVVN
jgi:hypothetical protein